MKAKVVKAFVLLSDGKYRVPGDVCDLADETVRDLVSRGFVEINGETAGSMQEKPEAEADQEPEEGEGGIEGAEDASGATDPEGAEGDANPEIPTMDNTVPEIKAFAADHEINLEGCSTKASMIEAIAASIG